MDFNTLRAQFNYLRALICPFIQVPSFQSPQNLLSSPDIFYSYYKETHSFLQTLQNNKWDTKLSKEFSDENFKNICFSHMLLNTNKSRICVFKTSAVSHVRTLLENIHYLF